MPEHREVENKTLVDSVGPADCPYGVADCWHGMIQKTYRNSDGTVAAQQHITVEVKSPLDLIARIRERRANGGS